MKRLNNLYHKIHHIDNINKADGKARKCKGRSYGVQKHDLKRDQDNQELSECLAKCQYKTSEYTTETIYEPKERLIYILPYYPDRITHHAIMNILEPVWTKIFTKDTYSCIKGRGIHALARKLQKDLKEDVQGTKYCLKLDIRKFYPSIDHGILKSIIRRKIKDRKVLQLLDEIIDSAPGVPIGNYLSQYFANLYMTYFDHWIKEDLKVKYYYRYADDIVLLSDSKDELRKWFIHLKEYLENNLKLQIKPNYQIYPSDSRGIDFVGYVFYHTHTKIRKSIKMKIWRLVRDYLAKRIDKGRFRAGMTSYAGWLKYCDSKNLLTKIQRLTGFKYSNWRGIEGKISRFYGKNIYFVDVMPYKKYFKILFVYKGNSYVVKSKSILLFTQLTSLQKYPTLIKLKKCLRQKK